MKRYISIIGFFIFTGCASNDNGPLTYQVDTRLTEYVTDFFADCHKNLSAALCSPPIDLKVYVTALPDDTLGECTIYENRLRKIKIDESILDNYNLRIVTYHELFHCVTNTPHYDNEMDIMNTYEYEENTRYMYDNWDYFVGKVFTRE